MLVDILQITTIAALIIFILTATIYSLTNGKVFKFFYHNILEWHIPNEDKSFDGCSYMSTCRICGKPILQDSQGNWFEV